MSDINNYNEDDLSGRDRAAQKTAQDKPSWWDRLTALFDSWWKKIEALITGKTSEITDRIEESDLNTKRSSDAVIDSVKVVTSTATGIVENIKQVSTAVNDVKTCVDEITHTESGIAATVIRENEQQITNAARKIHDALQALQTAFATADSMNKGFSDTGSKIDHAEQAIRNEMQKIDTAVSKMLHAETGITAEIKWELADRFQEMQKRVDDLHTAADELQKEHNTHHQELIGRFDKAEVQCEESKNDICTQLSVSEKRIVQQVSDTHTQVQQTEEAVRQLFTQVYNKLTSFIGNTIETLGNNVNAAVDANKRAIIEDMHKQVGAAAEYHKKQAEANKDALLTALTNAHDEVHNTLDTISSVQNKHQNTLNAVLEIVQDRLTAAESEIQSLAADKRTLNEALGTARGNATELDKLLKEEKKHTDALTEQIAHLKQEYRVLQQEKAELEQKYGAFIPLTAGYKQILKLALQCDSIKSVVGHISDHESTESLLKFLLIFGSEQSFAAKVYTVMREYKKQHKEPMNPSEYRLIEELNTFYRENQQIEFDIFELPESIDGVIKFDKNKMQDMEKPADTLIKGVETVYVPALRKDASVIAFKAIIKGIK